MSSQRNIFKGRLTVHKSVLIHVVNGGELAAKVFAGNASVATAACESGVRRALEKLNDTSFEKLQPTMKQLESPNEFV